MPAGAYDWLNENGLREFYVGEDNEVQAEHQNRRFIELYQKIFKAPYDLDNSPYNSLEQKRNDDNSKRYENEFCDRRVFRNLFHFRVRFVSYYIYFVRSKYTIYSLL